MASFVWHCLLHRKRYSFSSAELFATPSVFSTLYPMNISRLSQLERDIVDLLAEGFNISATSTTLGLSRGYVSKVLQILRDKYSVLTNEQLLYEIGKEVGKSIK